MGDTPPADIESWSEESVGVPPFLSATVDGETERETEAPDARYTPTPPPPRREREPGDARQEKILLATMALYGKVGMMVFFFNQADGLTILNSAEDRARELVAVAKLQPGLMRVLKTLTKSNAYIELGTGHLALVLALLSNHGVNIGDQIKSLFKPPTPKAKQPGASAYPQTPVSVPSAQPGEPAVGSVPGVANGGTPFGAVGITDTADRENPVLLGLEQRR